MATNNKVITDNLYSTLDKALSNKDNQKKYKNGIDKYLAYNADKYFVIGPAERPMFSKTDGDNYMSICGLERNQVVSVLRSSKNINSAWNIMSEPTHTVNAMAMRFSILKNNAQILQLTQWYLIVSLYPSLHFKYFKYGTNPACMKYTVMNLSNKYSLKQSKNLWEAFCNMMTPAYELHKDRLKNGDDMDYVKYIQDIHVRMNSLLKNVATEYYANYESQNFMETEFESFDEDSFHEAESNSQDIERITNNVVNHLVIHGPDMKLVELAAKSAGVSVNDLRTHMTNLINAKHKEDMWQIVESILFLYLFNNDGETHTVHDVRTNDFMLYCLKVYKKSNTNDKNVLKIKAILDRWLDETGITKISTRDATLLSYKKAFYTFFVLSIERYGK